MNPVYTLEQLKSFNRPQLWQLCKERGLKCYPKTADCVEAILNKQQSVEKVVAAEVTVDEQPRTCATCPLFQPFNDGTGRGICCGVADTSLVVRDHHTLTQDCQNLIDEQAVAQAELNEYVEAQALDVVPEIEIDSDADPDFGVLYRVWHGTNLIGTFYQAIDSEWVAQPCDSQKLRCNTASEAQLLIVGMAGLLVADSAYEDAVDQLLDKPFDELTIADWETIKQQAVQAEFVAA